MNLKKIIVKKSFVLATTAAIALVAGAGNAVAAPVDLVGGGQVTLIGLNLTKGCVRFYADGQHDVAAGSEWKSGTVRSGQGFTASVFPSACGGAATKTVRLAVPTTGVTSTIWTVR